MSEDFERQETLESILEKNKDKLSTALPRGYLSVSQVNQALRCWKQYEFRVIKGLIMPPSVALCEGKSVHRALEVGHKEQAKSSNVSAEVMCDAFVETWKTSKEEADWSTDEEGLGPAGIEKRGLELIKTYHRVQLPRIATRIINETPQVETPFLFLLDDVPILGVIDLIGDINEKTFIIDHKVVARKKSKDEIGKDIQLLIYSLYTKLTQGGFNCLVKTKNEVTFIEDEIPQEHGWLIDLLHDVIRTIKTGVFPRTHPGNWWCSPRFCGYYNLCKTVKTFT